MAISGPPAIMGSNDRIFVWAVATPSRTATSIQSAASNDRAGSTDLSTTDLDGVFISHFYPPLFRSTKHQSLHSSTPRAAASSVHLPHPINRLARSSSDHPIKTASAANTNLGGGRFRHTSTETIFKPTSRCNICVSRSLMAHQRHHHPITARIFRKSHSRPNTRNTIRSRQDGAPKSVTHILLGSLSNRYTKPTQQQAMMHRLNDLNRPRNAENYSRNPNLM
ncbi:hypothetical protein ACLOJK_006741 [Asimina triloba]